MICELQPLGGWVCRLGGRGEGEEADGSEAFHQQRISPLSNMIREASNIFASWNRPMVMPKQAFLGGSVKRCFAWYTAYNAKSEQMPSGCAPFAEAR